MDNISGDEALRHNAKLFELPSQLIRSKKEIEGMREQRAELSQKEEQQEDESHEAEVVNKVAPAM